jgi:hypothetical protein
MGNLSNTIISGIINHSGPLLVSSTLLGKAYTPIHQIDEAMGMTCKPNSAHLEHSNRCTAIRSIRYPLLQVKSEGYQWVFD